MQAAFGTDIAGERGAAPTWLRLTRAGASITGYQSRDGTIWDPVGTVNLVGLPATVEVGLAVASPLNLRYVQGGGATGIEVTATVGHAVFDHLAVAPASASGRGASDRDASGTGWAYRAVAPDPVPGLPQPRPGPGGMTVSGGEFTVVGAGDIAWFGIPSFDRPDRRDLVSDSLQGVQIGLLAIVVLGVLVATGEYRTGMIRTSLLACPHRSRLLAAKALVLAGATLLAGLVASAVAFVIAQSILHRRGMRPPAYPYRTLFEGDVLRAVTGTAAFLALLAVFALTIGMLVRRPSRAIPLVVALVMVPQILGSLLSLRADLWLARLTPAAGLAIQQTVVRYDTAIAPWAGLGVLAGYTAVAYALALWSLKARDA